MPENADHHIQIALAAVEEAESAFGKNDVRVSYKLDELAGALRAGGRLLDAANVAARAKAIRSATFAQESVEQEEKYGSVSSEGRPMTAGEWLQKLHRLALVGSAALFVITLIVPTAAGTPTIIKGTIGATLAGTFLQLLMFPMKSLPRFVKWTIAIIVSGIVGSVFFR